MRYLHPVQMHEKFVASGRYIRYCSTLSEEAELAHLKSQGIIEVTLQHDFGEEGRFYRGLLPVPMVEEWTIHELPDQSWLIRCDRYSPKYPNATSWLGEILRRDDGVIERIDLRCYDSSRLLSEASHLFLESSVLIGRRYWKNDGSLSEREHVEEPLPSGYIVDSGIFTITAGFSVGQMLNHQQMSGITDFTLFYPEEVYEDMETPYARLFMGHTVISSIQNTGKTKTTIIQGNVRSGMLYTITQSKKSGVVQQTSISPILIDDNGIVLNYATSLSCEERLEQYAHRPEPKRKS